MRYEQRLLIALGLTSGILLMWSLWAPPPSAPRPSQAPAVMEKTELVAPAGPKEQEQSFQLGLHRLGIGASTGGIRGWQAAEEPLLERSSPGFLEVRASASSEPLALVTTESEERLVSRGTLGGQLEIGRELEAQTHRHPHLVRCVLWVENKSSEEREAALQIALYKPVFEPQIASQKHFLSGTAWIDGKPKNLHLKPGQAVQFSGSPDWIVAQSRSSALIVQPESVPGVFHVEHPVGGGETGWLKVGPTLLRPGEKKVFAFRIYAGPAVLSELKKAGMEDALFFGLFSDITHGLLQFLSWSQGRLHNYGWAICLLSVALWLPFAPLTWYGMKISQGTMHKMAALKPQEARIRREHKNNPTKIQQELMELYRKNKVNPASGCIGCLPLLLTWPVYFALFQVLNRAPELQGASFFWIRDLSAPDALIRFPTALPLLGAGFNILPVLSTALYFLQQNAMPRPMGEMTEEQKVQQQMMKIMPLVLLFVFYNMPSGFMLYWVINSGLMAGQQTLLAKSFKAANGS